MNNHEIIEKLSQVKDSLRGTRCVVGGSAALVLQGYIKEAQDIDIVQHRGERININERNETRMWSRYYPDLNVDLHYSSIDHIEDYQKCFHKIIHALYYIDNVHSYELEDWLIATPKGAGLINWIHHFLDYGYNDERTLIPDKTDKIVLMSILGTAAYNRIAWNVEMSQTETQTSEAFREFALNWRP